MEEAAVLQTVVGIYQTKQHHIPKDCDLDYYKTATIKIIQIKHSTMNYFTNR
jgi:hypothetical protein